MTPGPSPQARELLAQQYDQQGRPDVAADLRRGSNAAIEGTDLALAAIDAALNQVPAWLKDPTPDMLSAGRTAVMAARVASHNWTPRQHYEASDKSTDGIPEDVLDEKGPLTKESEAVMVFGAMVAAGSNP